MTNAIDYYQTTFRLSRDHAEQICRIEARVEKMWEGNLSVPYFTTHGPLHNRAIIGLLRALIPEFMETPPYELERYLLLVGAWLHDIGMLDLDFFTEQYRPSAVRGQHHERSARWLVHCATELGLIAAEADAVAYIVKMHRKKENLEACPDQMWVGSQKVRIRLVAALLRLADALHIDETRAPLQEYSLYRMTGMPAEAKFHWVKARSVQGIELNLSQGLIKVQIDVPEKSGEGEFKPLADFIRQEIESELETVRHTLAKEGCPFFMDVSVEMTPIPGLERGSSRANEIDELNNLISIDVSPNARRLVTVILQSIEQINPEAQRQPTAKQVLDTLENLRDYAKDLVPKVVARRCHVAAVRAFVALVLLLKGRQPASHWHKSLNLFTLLDDAAPNDSGEPEAKEQMEGRLTHEIDKIAFPSDDAKCRDISLQINRYFAWELQLLEEAVEKLKEVSENSNRSKPILQYGDRILLYGTSASVIDLLKAIAKQEAKEGRRDLKEGLEIFVAECRVKSNYATTNIIFNDGIEYATRIAQIGYKKVAIVPDAAIAHLLLPRSYYEQAVEPTGGESGDEEKKHESQDTVWLKRPAPVTKIFFGFNGLDLDQKFAVHSCGHLALTLLAKRPGDGRERTSEAEVYLVGTTSKCGKVHYKHVEPRSTKTWLTGDIKSLEGPPRIYDYNPVDDIIKLDLVDHVVSDLGIMSPDDFIRACGDFLENTGKQLDSVPDSVTAAGPQAD